jgi:hypothetical protein
MKDVQTESYVYRIGSHRTETTETANSERLGSFTVRRYAIRIADSSYDRIVTSLNRHLRSESSPLNTTSTFRRELL